jgi:KDO2-lipid IV(A) lauroyltransferase
MKFTSDFSAFQKIAFYSIYGFIYTISLIPFRLMYMLSDLLFVVTYHFIRYRRKLVTKNIANSFPEKSHKERLHLERQFYHWFCDYIFETIKLASVSKKEMRRRVTYKNTEHLNELLDKGYSVILYLGHYCNWEWITTIGMFIPDDCFGGQVYRPLENKVMDALMLKLRSRMETESIPKSHIMRKIISLRREKRRLVVGFISDQVPIYPNTHYWSDFLNHENTLFLTGTERLAKGFGLACVYLDISRPRRGYYDIDIVPMTEDSKQYDDFKITEMYIRLFEKTIMRNPQYWLWTHNRWKRTYEGFKEWCEVYKKENNTEIHN